MVRGSYARDVGISSSASLKLATALEELRRKENFQWVIEKLEAAELLEDGRAVSRHNKAESAQAPSPNVKRRKFPVKDEGIPVEDFKRIIRELKLNAGQNFWKNNVTQEDLIKVLTFHFRGRQPVRKSPNTATTRVVNSLKGGTPDYERARMVSAKLFGICTAQIDETRTATSYAGILAREKKNAKLEERKPQSPSNSIPLQQKKWRDFNKPDVTKGILYQTRVGAINSHDWKTTKEFARRRRLPLAYTEPPSGALSSETAAFSLFGGSPGSKYNTSSKKRENETSAPRSDEITLIRRQCAKSIYELSTKPKNGPLLVENGVFEALTILSMIDDPKTMRYVGASYVNIAALHRDYCRSMLHHKVVHDLFQLWERAKSLAYPELTLKPPMSSGTNGGAGEDVVGKQTDEDLRNEKCGMDVISQVVMAFCHLTMVAGSENMIAQEDGIDAILWYARYDHGEEGLKVLGLHCLANLHLHFPSSRTLHEVIMPCLRELGQSPSLGTRRFVGDTICALASNKRSGSQLMSEGVVWILAGLSTVPGSYNLTDGAQASKYREDLLVEVCARGTALLSRVSGEIFDQVITTPEPFVVLLEVLYRRGGIAHTKAETVQSGDKVSKTCRLGIAKLMKAIFSEANESGVSRLVNLGFLAKVGIYLKQAEAFQDFKALELLSLSVWYMTITLTDPRSTISRLVPKVLDGKNVSLRTRQRDRNITERKSSSSFLVQTLPEQVLNLEYVNRRTSAFSTTRNASHRISVIGAADLGAGSASRRRAEGGTGPRLSIRMDSRGVESQPSRRVTKTDMRVETAPFPKRRSIKIFSQESMAGSMNDGGGILGAEGREGRRSNPGVAAAIEEGSEVELQGCRLSISCEDDPVEKEDSKQGPHVVACGVMNKLLRLLELGSTALIREYCQGALCNLASKPWVTAELCAEIGVTETLLKSVGAAVARKEERTSELAVKGLWNLVCRMVEAGPFIERCLQMGMIESLCAATKGAAELLLETDEQETRTTRDPAASSGLPSFPSGNRPINSVEGIVLSMRLRGCDDAGEALAAEGTTNRTFRTHMKHTMKICLRISHAFLKHKRVRLTPAVLRVREELLKMLVSCLVGGAQVAEIAMAIMCNLTHDICCDLEMLERTGALQHSFSQVFSPSSLVQKHVAGILGNLANILESTPTGCRAVDNNEMPITVFQVLKRLAEVNDQCIAFRASSILYALTRKNNYSNMLPLRGLCDVFFKLFRSGVSKTQNYCLQAFFNLAHHEDFAMSIIDSDLMEGFIVACMVLTNSSHIKDMCSQVLFFLLSSPCTRLSALKGQGLWTLVQLAGASDKAVPMRLALLALFNLACNLRTNIKWLDEHSLTAALDFDDDVLGAPAFPGLLYIASTHDGRLSEILVSTRIAREARVKLEGFKFLTRNRVQEEDNKVMAETVAVSTLDDQEVEDVFLEGGGFNEERRPPMEVLGGQRSRLRPTFVATHTMPTLAMVYNLCCKSLKAVKLFYREGVPETIGGLLDEMRATDNPGHFHPHVYQAAEILCVAVLGCMIEDTALVPKLIQRGLTKPIVKGLYSPVVPVRLASLWALVILSIPTPAQGSVATGEDQTSAKGLSAWRVFCSEAIIECSAVAALWSLWESVSISLPPEPREQARYAISTVVRMAFMDQEVAAAMVRQRGVELLAKTMASRERSLVSTPHISDEGSDVCCGEPSLMNHLSTLCCAVPSVHLPDIPLRSICEGGLGVFLNILPTSDDDVRDLCSLAMRSFTVNEKLFSELIALSRFTDVLKMLLVKATAVGLTHIREILQHAVVLSKAPEGDELSPDLMNLADIMFRGDVKTSLSTLQSAVSGTISFSIRRRNLADGATRRRRTRGGADNKSASSSMRRDSCDQTNVDGHHTDIHDTAGGAKVRRSISRTDTDKASQKQAVGKKAHLRERIGSDNPVAIDGIFASEGEELSEKNNSNNLGLLIEGSDGSSRSDQVSDEELQIKYTEDDILQVQRLVSRVVGGGLPATEESSMDLLTEIQTVTKSNFVAFQQISEKFLKEIMLTRRGQALPLPRCNRHAEDGEGVLSGSTPESEPSWFAGAELVHSGPWDPAQDVLEKAGMPRMEMVPRWTFSHVENLCTTRFVVEDKIISTPEPGLPVPLPEEPVLSVKKIDNPFLIESCVLGPLEIPISKTHSQLPKSELLQTNEESLLTKKSSDRTAQSDSDFASNRPSISIQTRRKSSIERNLANATNTKSSTRRIRGGSEPVLTVQVKTATKAHRKKSRDGNDRGRLETELWNGRRFSSIVAPGEPLTEQHDDGCFSGTEKKEAHKTFFVGSALCALPNTSHKLALSLAEEAFATFSLGRVEIGPVDSRSDISALASSTLSLRARRHLEKKKATLERNKFLNSLGVGGKRAQKPAIGKTAPCLLVVAPPCGRSSTSSAPLESTSISHF